MTLFRWLCALALLVSFTPATAQTFPKLTGQVVDDAHILNPAQIAALTAQSAEIEKATTRQFIVATIADLQGYAIEDYGYRLGRAWGIGQKDANNGIILIVAPNDRKVRIEVGYGLEPIMTDALSSQIIRDTILPKFKAGDLPGGIIAGAAEIAEQMKLPLEAGEARAAQVVKKRPRSAGTASDWFVAIVVMVIIFAVVLPMLFGGSRGRRYRSSNVAGAVGDVILWSALNSLSNGGRSSGWGGGGSDWGGGGGSDWGGGGGGSFGGGGSSGSW